MDTAAVPVARLTAHEERFELWRRRVGLVAGPVLAGIVWLVPIPDLPDPAHRMLAVMALVGTWWLTEAMPLPSTAILGPALAVLLGIAPVRDALRPFSDPVIFLFLGGFMLAEAMVKHRLNRRIALRVLTFPWVGRSPLGLLAGFGMLTAAISAWVSNTATAAMMLPIAMSILPEVAGGTGGNPSQGADSAAWRRSPIALALILVTAFGASIGGLATPIGTPPNLIGIGLIERHLERRLLFAEWMRFAAPAALLLIGALIFRMHRIPGLRASWKPSDRGWLLRERGRLGRWSRAEVITATVFAAAIALWILPGSVALVSGRDAPGARWLQERLPESVVAVLAAASLFLLPAGDRRTRVLEWSDAGRIDWGTILLFGGGMALGSMMFETGLAHWIGEGLATLLPAVNVFTLTLLFAGLGVLVSEATSNTASATMIIPLAIAVADAAGVDALRPALAACLGCSLGFMLPVSTPPNALAYGTGVVPLMKMVRHGIWLDVVGCAVVVACVLSLTPR